MNALDAVLARAQPRYEKGVGEVVDNLRDTFGQPFFDNLAVEQLAETVTAVLERRAMPTGDGLTAIVIRNLHLLEWCAALPVDDDVKTRLARMLRTDYRAPLAAAGLKRPKPDVAARRAHVVFAGQLDTPLHSPSAAAAGYLRALAGDPKNRRIDVYHNGPIHPDLAARMDEQLPKTVAIRFHRIEETPDYLSDAVEKGPCTYHFWCYPRMMIDYSFMAMFGPTVMFTCADEAPLQYADVYWSIQPPEHIAKVWTAAPRSYVDNYVACAGGHIHVPAPAKVRSKADFGMPEGELLLVTVGNRLGVDIDEAFVTGVELALRTRPHCSWLVVGALPDWLKTAMRTVLDHRFIHLDFDPDLSGLMPAADVWLNPFRRGGGASAVIAASAGLPVLTRGDIGDVASCVPAGQCASGVDDYFAKLGRLLDDADERAAWGEAQHAFFLDTWENQERYVAEVDRMVALAFARFRARAGRCLDVVFPEDTPAAAAAA
jgi:hypothetical protein